MGFWKRYLLWVALFVVLAIIIWMLAFTTGYNAYYK